MKIEHIKDGLTHIIKTVVMVSTIFLISSLTAPWTQNDLHAADMEDYCVVPPYVKRDVAPNIMILMDNSDDMLNPAYTDVYDPAKPYAGYFNPGGCYKDSGNIFDEVYKSTSPDISYTLSDTCPDSAPFRGNLMNWAATSKYDLLQKVLIGGNATSKQGNAHTLVSIDGDWTLPGVKDNDTYGGCKFIVQSGTLTIQDDALDEDIDGKTVCDLIKNPASPIASIECLQDIALAAQSLNRGENSSGDLSYMAKQIMAMVSKFWERISIVSEAEAAVSPCTLSVGSLNATVGVPYSLVLTASGDNTNTYTWTYSGIPAWLSGPTYGTKNRTATWTGTPLAAGNDTFTATVGNTKCTSVSITQTIVVSAASIPLAITSPSLPDGTVNTAYSSSPQVSGTGGVLPYTWSAANLPLGLSINAGTGEISGTPTVQGNYNNIIITLTDSNASVDTKTFSMKILAGGGGGSSKSFTLKVSLIEEPLNDVNGNDIYDSGIGESYTDLNGNGSWDGKQGVFQKYWDDINPRARWGLTQFSNQGVSIPSSGCIPASPASSFYTAIQNVQHYTSPLADGLYGDINYYMFNQTGYKGCSNSDPIDDVKCRKNFVLILSSGADVGGSNFPDSSCTVPNNNSSAPLVQDACYANNTDLRGDKTGTQNVFTYVVNTLGAANAGILEDTANAGGGNYYDAQNPTKLDKALDQAFKDMLARAASGTAASVLASGEGSGANLVQAVFYPRRKFYNPNTKTYDEIGWTGRLTNLWYYIDPLFGSSSIREDTDKDYILNLQNDFVANLYFDPTTEQTYARRYQDTNGDGSSLVEQLPQVTLENTNYLWEAGELLWSRDPDTRTIYTTVDGTTMLPGDFKTPNASTLAPYLQATDLNGDLSTIDDAEKIIRYVRGEDFSSPPDNFRSRTVTIGGNTNVWKLGDVINSTARIASWLPLNKYHKDYRDDTYGVPNQDPLQADAPDANHFITTDDITKGDYKHRGMVYAGGNDGMLHAFKLGILEPHWGSLNKYDMARLVNPETGAVCSPSDVNPCGKEMWAFIPKNALPYLKYQTDTGYCHVYTVDLSPYIFDASIQGGSAAAKSVSSWRTILIGGMRWGGACKPMNLNCSAATPDGVCAPTQVSGTSVGYSSYFALDVTDEKNPTLLWEFSNPELGFATTGPAVVRVGADKTKNGNWYVVFGSGPTGPISSYENQFMGRSDQNLKFFVLDLATGAWQTTIDTGISFAFAGSMLNSTNDSDQDYQDDAVYVGYVKRTGSSPNYKWEDGGVGRILTGENTSPASWKWSAVMDGIGPVTSAVVRLQDNKYNNLWLYFGTGRFFYDTDSEPVPLGQRRIFGVKEPCFSALPVGIDPACSSTVGALTDVTDVANAPTESAANASGFNGWYVDLDPAGDYTYMEGSSSVTRSYYAERVITDPLATITGLVFFTTYKPYVDECSMGGKSLIWSIRYNSGGAPDCMLNGKALVQVSTGSIEQVDLTSSSCSNHDPNNPNNPNNSTPPVFNEFGGRRTSAMEGVPPMAQGMAILTTPPPINRFLHKIER